MERIERLANLYTATLRAIYHVETFCHWTTKGLGFYGNHLLFERLYKGFTNFWTRKGFKLDEPEFPLVAIVFGSREAYAKWVPLIGRERALHRLQGKAA